MKKLFYTLAMVIITAMIGWSQTTTNGSYYSTVLDSSGHPISNAVIKVYIGGNCGTSCNSFATIYYDFPETVPVDQTNAPVVSDINGNFHFFAQSGAYDIVIHGRGVDLKLTNSVLGASTIGGFATGITPSGSNGTFWGVQSGVQGWYAPFGLSGLAIGGMVYANTGTTITTDGAILTDGLGTLSASEFNGPLDGIVGGMTPSAGTFTTLIGSSLQVTGISGSTQCIHADTSGNFTGTGTDCEPAFLSGVTGTITGTALTSTCDSGTASVSGAVVGDPVVVSTTDGTDVGGAFDLRASVTSTNVVTVYICGTGTPSNKAYNVRVIP